MNQCLRSLACLVAVAALAVLPTELAAKSSHKSSASKKTHEAKAGKQRHATAKSRHGKHADAKRKSKQDDEPSDKPAPPPLTGDLAALKDAIDLARKGKTADATAIEAKLTDPTAQKLVEWVILRHPDADVSYSR